MDPLSIGDRIAAIGKWLRGLFMGRADAEDLARERRRQLLRDIATAMGEVFAETEKLGHYTPYSTIRLKVLHAELEVARLSSEVSDETLRDRLLAFRQMVQAMIKPGAGARAPTDQDLAALRRHYEAALDRISELQRELA